MTKLFLVVNVDWFFLSHRKDIARAALEAGYDVTVVTHFTGSENDIRALGVKVLNLPMTRTGMNPFSELQSFLFLRRLYRKEKPDIVHHVGMKTMLWGTLAASSVKNTQVVNAVSGTGMFFSAEKQKSPIVRLVLHLLKKSSRPSYKYIFQNDDDRRLFEQHGISTPEQAVLIQGSGVDLDIFKYVSEDEKQSDILKLVFTGRMLESKGVLVIAEAARILKEKYAGKIQFLLCGALDENPASLTENDVRSICDGDYVQWLGFQKNIYEVLRECHVMLFPSFYMEGLPKSVIDAETAGLPVITTDWVGCRDTVQDGYNGFLIPAKNASALAEKISYLIENPELRKMMGKNARAYAEEHFSLAEVIKRHLETYKSLEK